MKHHIILLTICCCSAGCVGPATQRLHESSLRFDPLPQEYISAFRSSSHAYVHYKPGMPEKNREQVVSATYWASVPLEQLDDYRFDGWTIYRNRAPIDLESGAFTPVQIVDISGVEKPTDRKFINRDAFLTYIIESREYDLPVLLHDLNGRHGFHLIGPEKLHGSYRGLWNPPKGTFRDRSVVLTNSWKYPLYMIGDFVMFPFYYLIAQSYPTM